MIDKSGNYWVGDSADDIKEYLEAYSGNSAIDVKPILCHSCGSNSLNMRVDCDEDVIQVKCPKCGYKKILLDCEEVWEDSNPRLCKCPVCKNGKEYNIQIGFSRRENGSVKWVYIGNRCINCGVLGSYLDWEVNYEPTDEMENNI